LKALNSPDSRWLRLRQISRIHSEDSADLQKTARGGVFSLVGLILNAVFGFGFIAIVSHSMPQASAGGFFEAVALWTIASTIAVLGADVGLVRTLPAARRSGPNATRRLFRLACGPVALASVLLAIAVLAAAPEIARLIVSQSLVAATTSQLRLLAPLIPFGALTTVLMTGTRAWRTGPSVSVQYILVPTIRPLILGVFAATGVTAVGVAFAWGLPVLLGGIVSGFVVYWAIRSDEESFRSSTLEGPKPATASLSRRFWSFAAPRSVEGVLLILLSWFDVVLVGALASPRQAAPYAGAMRYVIMGAFALQAIGLVVAPRVSYLTQQQHDQSATSQLYRVSTVWVVLGSFPPLLTLAVFAPTFMSVLGHGYRIGATALSILALGMLTNTATGSNAMFLLMSGRSTINLTVTALSLVTNLTLNFLLIPHLGLTGAAIAFSASFAITSFAMAAFLLRTLGLHPLCRIYGVAILGSVVCFGVPGLVLRLTVGASFVVFGLFAAGSIAAYGLFLYRFRDALRLDLFRTS
jgi:O-antigen/teichoic acid export membrane protein